MKNELVLKQPGVMELGEEGLKEVEGGLPLLLLGIVTAWAVVCLLTD